MDHYGKETPKSLDHSRPPSGQSSDSDVLNFTHAIAKPWTRRTWHLLIFWYPIQFSVPKSKRSNFPIVVLLQ